MVKFKITTAGAPSASANQAYAHHSREITLGVSPTRKTTTTKSQWREATPAREAVRMYVCMYVYSRYSRNCCAYLVRGEKPVARGDAGASLVPNNSRRGMRPEDTICIAYILTTPEEVYIYLYIDV